MPYPRLAILAAVVAVLCIGIGVWWYRQYETRYFTSTLERAGIDTGGSLPTLRLAYAQAMARNNPLIALPGVNPDELTTQVAALAKLMEELAALQTNAGDAEAIRALYPVDFLGAAAALERARVAFVASGSAHDAALYEKAQRDALAKYRNDLERFRNAYLQVVPESIGAYATPTRIITRDATLKALDTLQSGMEVTAHKIAARTACVRGLFIRCSANDTAPPRTSATASALATTTEYEVRSALQAAGYSVSGTLYTLPNAACTTNSAARPPVFVVGADTVTLVSDAALISFDPAGPNAQLPFVKYFLDRGTTYIPAHPLIYYNCPESDADYGAVLATATGNPSDTTLERWSNSLGLLQVTRDILIAERGNMAAQRKGVDMGITAKQLFFARSAMPTLFLAHNPSATGKHAPLYESNMLPQDTQPYVWYSSGTIRTGDLVRSLAAFRHLYAQP